MGPVIFTLMILGFISLNIILPVPYQPVTEIFHTLSHNIAGHNLMNREIEKLAFNYTQIVYKQKKIDLKKIIHGRIQSRIALSDKVRQLFMRICKISLQERNIPSSDLSLICNQLIGASANIMENENMATMLQWRVFLHSLVVRNRFDESPENLLEFASNEGSYLAYHLFTARDSCYWNQKDKKCHPNRDEYLLLYKEDIYSTYEEESKKASADLQREINDDLHIFNALNSTKIALQIKDGTLNLLDNNILDETRVLLEKFKLISVKLMIKKVNLIISQLRDFKEKPFSPEKKKYNITIAEITEGTFLDLRGAFKRCTKKYSYCPCSKVNEGNVAFKCQDGANDADKMNLTLYSHKCHVIYYKRVNTVNNQIIGLNNSYVNGVYPTLGGEIFPWMLGDMIDYKGEGKF